MILGSQPQLETLDVSQNSFTSDHVAALLRDLPEVTPTLTQLAMNAMVMVADRAQLRTIPELYDINLPLRSLEL